MMLELKRACTMHAQGVNNKCHPRMALYNGYKCAISLAAQWSILLYFHELWQLMMTSQTCLG
jgi:hypothetical protein